MPDRSDIILNRVTSLTEWGEYRDIILDELIRAGFTDPNNIIRSEFTIDHFHYPELLAALIHKATDCHDSLHIGLRSSDNPLEMALSVNQMRDQFEGRGNFNSTLGWLEQTGWDIVGGAAEANVGAADPAREVYSDIDNLSVGRRYLFQFEVAAYISGSFRTAVRGTLPGLGNNFDSEGVHFDVALPNTGPTGFGLRTNPGEGFVGVIHDFIVREIP